MSQEEIHELTYIDPWFIDQLAQIVELEDQTALRRTAGGTRHRSAAARQAVWVFGSPVGHDLQYARDGCPRASHQPGDSGHVQVGRYLRGRVRSLHTLLLFHVRGRRRNAAARIRSKQRVMILGGGPNRIGQGIEFDYCCCHASFALRELGIESIMVNSNPETVSTDYDTSDLLFFEPLTTEDVLNICDRVQPDGVIVQFGGQTPLNLSRALATAGVPIIGTSVDTIEAAEDREKFQQLLERLDLKQPANGIARNMATARLEAKKVGFPALGAAQFCARGTGDGDLLRPGSVRAVRGGGVCGRPRTTRADRPVPGRCHRSGRRCHLRRRGSGRHGRDGTHRGSGRPFGRFRLRHSTVQSARTGGAGDPRSDPGHGAAPAVSSG